MTLLSSLREKETYPVRGPSAEVEGGVVTVQGSEEGRSGSAAVASLGEKCRRKGEG